MSEFDVVTRLAQGDRLISQMEANRQDYLKRWKAIRDFQLPYIGQVDDTADSTDYARRRDTNIYHSVA